MIFDIKDVKSWATRHDVKIGDEGYFANDIHFLDDIVSMNLIGAIEEIDENDVLCFKKNGTNNFGFFLPLDAVKKDKPEKKYRPFKDVYEFYNFIGVILTITRKEFRNRMLLGLPITYRKRDTRNFTTTELITSVEDAIIDSCHLTIINGKELEYWFANYEIMNADEEWQPFGAVENCTGE